MADVRYRLVVCYADGTIYDILECSSFWTLKRIARRCGYSRPWWRGQITYSTWKV